MARAGKRVRSRSITLSVLLVLLALLSLLAASGKMGAAEAKVFDVIYSMPDSLRWFALVATQLGNFWLAIGIVGLLFVIRWNPALSLMVLRNSLLAYTAASVLKVLVGRPRPVMLLNEITAREAAVFGNGFPSGHVAIATALSLTLYPYLPKRWRWLAVMWIVLVAWSRIYLGVHAPLDVAGGFVVGALVVLLADTLPWPVKKTTEKRS